MLSLNFENTDSFLNTLESSKEKQFSSNEKLLDKQSEVNSQIVEYIQKNIEIDSGCNDMFRKCLLEFVNIWKPSIEWSITSFFTNIDFSSELNDYEKSFCPTFTLKLKTTAKELCSQVSIIDLMIRDYLSSVLVRCCDIELVQDLYNNLFKNCCNSTKDRFMEFISDQYDPDSEVLLSDYTHSLEDNNKKDFILSEECLKKIDDILSIEKSFLNRAEFAEYKSKYVESIKQLIAQDLSRTDSHEKQIAEKILIGWQPYIVWDYNIRLHGLEGRTDNGAELLVTHLKYTLVPKTTVDELIDYISRLVRSVINMRPQHKSVNGEKQFLRDLYTQVYVYLDVESKNIMERILCSKCNVCFLDYSDEYIEDGYFEIMSVENPDYAGPKRRAFVSEIGGECLGKGLFIKYNRHG